MSRFYSELLIDEILNILSTNLNTEIAALNADDSLPQVDGNALVLNTIDSGKFYFQRTPTDLNATQWVLVWADGPFISEAEGSGVSTDIVINIALQDESLLAQFGGRPEIIDRIFMRYTEAIRETLAKDFATVGGYGRVKIVEMPVNTELSEEPGESVQVAAVSVSFNFAI